MSNPEVVGLSVAAAAKFLGVGKTTVYELIRKGRLPAYKLGKRTIIKLSDLQALLASLRPFRAA